MEPIGQLDERFSQPDATPTEWTEARRRLEESEIFWISTVRSDGRPHVTPLLAVWDDSALYFCTGPTEQKARNLEHNPHVVLTTGSNELGRGLDLVVEGDAELVRDDQRLERLAGLWVAKYGPDWQFDVRDGAFTHEAGTALVFEVAPAKVLAFGKGAFSQTRFAPART